jgi:regulator of sirC expression with transglutaminase-like and TPR domain
MEYNKGESLIKLLDDPDPLVFEAVRQEILQVGPELLPDLETAAIQAMSPLLHTRIEKCIKILQFYQLKSDLGDWIVGRSPRLLDGAWLLSRYHFPDLTKEQFWQLLKPLRDEIWLELSDTLTGLEKIGVFNTLFFKQGGVHLNNDFPDAPINNFIYRVIETKKANEQSLSLLYSILCQEVDMPVYFVEMPDYPILSYLDMPVVPDEIVDPGLFDVLFYINPTDNGTLHSRNDITNFLLRQSLPLEPIFYEPRANPDFIHICLKRLAADYKLAENDLHTSRLQELLSLWK